MSEDNGSRTGWTARRILDLLRFADLEKPYYDNVKIYSGESEKIRPFFVSAFQDRLFWYIIPVVSMFISALLFYFDFVSSPIQLFTSLLELSGAVILGIGLLRSEVGIERDSTMKATNKSGGAFHVGGDEKKRNELDLLSVSSEARDTVDAFTGILFLSTGFAVQIISKAF